MNETGRKIRKFRLFAQKHHNINLYSWQIKVIELILSINRGKGKTTLITALYVFDKNENNIDDNGEILK